MPGVSVEFEGHVPHIGVVKTGCQGICELGPLMRIEPLHYQYVKVQMDDCEEIFKRTVLNKEPVERLFYKKGEESFPHRMISHSLPSRPGSLWKTADALTRNLWMNT